ncbi:MAG TPA: polymorphic toxin-type HINT domain-containing protein, partial [Saprospiraceae bacterium]|nr:polymorphic toxin-type HINT domain-containing protein [Saprospiraceae bacterium]
MWRFLSILFLLFGVLTQFLLFSTTYNDWRLAGELGVGEKVLAYHGEATVTNTEKKVGSEAVYNLEVKDLHNFLVGDLGVVVHNG